MTIKHRTRAARHLVVLILTITTILWLVQFSGAIAAPPGQGQDIAIITDPPNGAVVQGAVPIFGSADYPSFQFYILEYSPEPATDDQWHIIGEIHETSVLNGQLEVWDTTLVPDGSYTLRLRVVRLDGNYSESFVRQLVISNAQPIPTDTPTPTTTPSTPTITPTPLPPTPTIVVEQPIVDTPTPRPVETSSPLEDPDENTSFIPTVTGFSLVPLGDACLYGAGVMLSIFLLFGFLSVLRTFIYGFVERIRRRRRRKQSFK